MASRGVQRTQAEKQALKQHTKKIERQRPKAEGRRRDFPNEIEFNNAATSGHAEDPIPTRPNSRSALADRRRAAEKSIGAMSLSKKLEPDLKVAGIRDKQDQLSARMDGSKTSRGARRLDDALDRARRACRTPPPSGVAPNRTPRSRKASPRRLAAARRRAPRGRRAAPPSSRAYRASASPPSPLPRLQNKHHKSA